MHMCNMKALSVSLGQDWSFCSRKNANADTRADISSPDICPDSLKIIIQMQFVGF